MSPEKEMLLAARSGALYWTNEGLLIGANMLGTALFSCLKFHVSARAGLSKPGKGKPSMQGVKKLPCQLPASNTSNSSGLCFAR